MRNVFLLAIIGMATFSCSTYNIAERFLDRKMSNADLSINMWVDFETADTIEYWDNNIENKPVMILVHGFGASTKYQFSKQVEFLSEHYRLILPNLYHFGNTRPGSTKYGVNDQVDMINRLLIHLNLSNYSLCGVSYGGLVCIELANQKRTEIDRLILFDAPIKFMDSVDLISVKEYFDVSSIEELFAPDDPVGLRKLLYLATGKKSRLPKIMLKEFHAQAYANNLEDKRMLITDLIISLEDFQSREYRIYSPVLLVWGEKDMVVPAERGKLLRDYLGENAQLHVIKKSAHMPNMTNAKEFNKILSDFLEL